MTVITIVGGDPEDWGLIPSFLDDQDPRPAKDQINEKYVGGWNSFKGFTFDPVVGTITYPGDPPYKPRSSILFRDEVLVIYDSAWVLILQPDKTWEVARLD